jgi:hypothetical protein
MTVYRIKGRGAVSRDEWLKDAPGCGGGCLGTVAYSGSKPLNSIALGCHPEMVGEYNAAAKKQGLTGIRWMTDGSCEITSRGDRAKWLRSQQQHDDDGGYGDG